MTPIRFYHAILRLCGIVMPSFQPANLYVVYHLAQGVAVGLEYVGLSARILYALWRNQCTIVNPFCLLGESPAGGLKYRMVRGVFY